jgi:hypothetical protein
MIVPAPVASVIVAFADASDSFKREGLGRLDRGVALDRDGHALA